MTSISSSTLSGKTETLRLVLPMPLNIGNARMHWRVKNRERKAYLSACDWLMATRQIPDPPTTPIPFAAIRVDAVVWSLSDIDNMMARCKWAVDWLVTRGYLAGDDPKRLKWTHFPTQTIDRKRPAELQITLTPLEDSDQCHR